MNRRNLIVLAAAAVIALFAVLLVNTWFSGVQQRQNQPVATPAVTRIVVASQELAFGTPLTEANVRMVDWPRSSVPDGAFTTIPDALKGGRVALRPIEVGEPVLADRVSGPDGRASIAYNIPGDMRAVAIPISAVAGVGGFVAPGDVVDIFLTRAAGDSQMTSVVLENVQVLAIDQLADEKKTNPKVGRTATVLTDLYGAQKLTLARQIGSLSLALRNVQNQAVGSTRVVTARDLGGSGFTLAASRPAAAVPSRPSGPALPVAPVAPRIPSGPAMTIYRGTADTQYEVPRYGLR